MTQELSEELMRLRMKEINNERDKLKEEYNKYEMYFYKKKQEKEREVQKRCIGKCFKLKSYESNKIKAFKVLNISEYSLDDANCVTLIETENKKEISVQNIYIFGYAKLQLMHRESDPKFLDMYKEISQEEFIDIYNEYVREMGNKVYEV